VEFDTFSFLIGILAGYGVLWMGTHIVAIVQTRIREEAEWKTVLSESTPSANYRANNPQLTTQLTSDDEEWVKLKPASKTEDGS